MTDVKASEIGQGDIYIHFFDLMWLIIDTQEK